jgi:penicillin G amidase
MGSAPAPGWSAEYEWTGHISFDDLPNSFNPESGHIVMANNRVVEDDYPYHITHEWAPGFRAGRIDDLLSTGERLDMGDMQAVQLDVYSSVAAAFRPYILEAGELAQGWALGGGAVVGPERAARVGGLGFQDGG